MEHPNSQLALTFNFANHCWAQGSFNFHLASSKIHINFWKARLEMGYGTRDATHTQRSDLPHLTKSNLKEEQSSFKSPTSVRSCLEDGAKKTLETGFRVKDPSLPDNSTLATLMPPENQKEQTKRKHQLGSPKLISRVPRTRRFSRSSRRKSTSKFPAHPYFVPSRQVGNQVDMWGYSDTSLSVHS